MAAEKGNQYALGNNGGRPRTVSLPPNEMIELGKEMVQWVIENKPLHISHFYSVHKGYLKSQWDTMIECNEFLPYYERSMRIIGLKYLDKSSNVRDGISQRWQRVYFKDLVEQEDNDLDAQSLRDARIEKEAKLNANADIAERLDKMHSQLDELQSSSKIAVSNNNSDK